MIITGMVPVDLDPEWGLPFAMTRLFTEWAFAVGSYVYYVKEDACCEITQLDEEYVWLVGFGKQKRSDCTTVKP